MTRTSTLAKLALIFSCCGLITPLFIGSIAGIVCGHMALGELHRQPALRGRAVAVWGLVIGYLTIPVVFVAAYMLLRHLGH